VWERRALVFLPRLIFLPSSRKPPTDCFPPPNWSDCCRSLPLHPRPRKETGSAELSEGNNLSRTDRQWGGGASHLTFTKDFVSSHKASIITYIMRYIFVYDIMLLGYDRWFEPKA